MLGLTIECGGRHAGLTRHLAQIEVKTFPGDALVLKSERYAASISRRLFTSASFATSALARSKSKPAAIGCDSTVAIVITPAKP